VDLVLASAAAALRWHPVSDFVHERPAVVYWGVGLAHIAIAPMLTMHAATGGREARDLILDRQGRLHGSVFRAAFGAVLTTSFVVPFVCARALPVQQAAALSVAVFFAPYAFVALVFAPLRVGRALSRRTQVLFDTRGGRIVLGALLMVYLVLMESTMLLCVESQQAATLLAALVGLVVSYLPVRLIVFYMVTRSESRAEVVSFLLGAAFVAAQLVAAA
jgi:hypothetical protein